MGIPHGHGDVLVSKQLLDLFQTGTPHHQLACKGMAKIMKSEIFDSGPLACADEAGSDVLNCFDHEAKALAFSLTLGTL